MRLVIYSVIVLFFATWLAFVAEEDPGYIMITYRDWTIESSFTLFAVAALICFTAFYFTLRLIIGTGFAPRKLKKWRHHRGEIKAEKELTKGLVDLNMGRWDQAEKHLRNTAKNPNLSTVGYMAAAQAAQGMGETKRRDGYMQMAMDGGKAKTKLAVRLNQAQLLSQAGQPEEGIAILKKLPPNLANKPQTLAALAQLYTQQKDWSSLDNLLPRLRRAKAIPMEKYYALEHTVYSGVLNEAGRSKDALAINKVWDNMPARLQAKEDMIIDYASSLMNIGHNDTAEELLYARISKNWNENLVYVYGLLEGDAEIHLCRAKNWLKKHESSPVLQLTMGRLAIRAHQWQVARDYLEQSLSTAPNAETYQELGNLLVHENETEKAIACFRQGLAIASENMTRPVIGDKAIEHAKLPSPKQINFEPLSGALLENDTQAKQA